MAYIYSNALRERLLAGDEPAWLQRHPRRTYVVNVILATPAWVDRAQMRRINERARRRIDCVRDHIVPLTHPLVCGLNVPWNLRIIPRLENAKRSNSWWEYTADLFTEPEQLSLSLMGHHV